MMLDLETMATTTNFLSKQCRHRVECDGTANKVEAVEVTYKMEQIHSADMRIYDKVCPSDHCSGLGSR
jgi:hypothetical protein